MQGDPYQDVTSKQVISSSSTIYRSLKYNMHCVCTYNVDPNKYLFDLNMSTVACCPHKILSGGRSNVTESRASRLHIVVRVQVSEGRDEGGSHYQVTPRKYTPRKCPIPGNKLLRDRN
jgi:hypothetical protein